VTAKTLTRYNSNESGLIGSVTINAGFASIHLKFTSTYLR
jgi:hypothetical protein